MYNFPNVQCVLLDFPIVQFFPMYNFPNVRYLIFPVYNFPNIQFFPMYNFPNVQCALLDFPNVQFSQCTIFPIYNFPNVQFSQCIMCATWFSQSPLPPWFPTCSRATRPPDRQKVQGAGVHVYLIYIVFECFVYCTWFYTWSLKKYRYHHGAGVNVSLMFILYFNVQCFF